MSGQTKFILGLAGLCVLVFFLTVGIWRSPAGLERSSKPVQLPKLEELGRAMPSALPVAAQEPRPAGQRLGIAPASKSSNKLMPSPEEMKRMQKDGSVVY